MPTLIWSNGAVSWFWLAEILFALFSFQFQWVDDSKPAAVRDHQLATSLGIILVKYVLGQVEKSSRWQAVETNFKSLKPACCAVDPVLGSRLWDVEFREQVNISGSGDGLLATCKGH